MAKSELPVRLIVGSTYHDSSPLRATPPAESELRKGLIARLERWKAEAFDQQAEQSAAALLAVLDWHRPWQLWAQTFAPGYIGDRYQGQGCRSCDWRSVNDCPTVTAVAAAIGYREGAKP